MASFASIFRKISGKKRISESVIKESLQVDNLIYFSLMNYIQGNMILGEREERKKKHRRNNFSHYGQNKD